MLVQGLDYIYITISRKILFIGKKRIKQKRELSTSCLDFNFSATFMTVAMFAKLKGC